MNRKLMKIRPLDYAAVLFALGLTTFVAIAIYSDASGSSHVQIRADGGEWLYALESDRELEFEGPLGITHIEISDGSARVVDSPCTEKICINAGALDSSGDWTACLPNRIFVRITGNEETEIDALSY
ncbi:MAG: NusG domain II-containing protein [Spirochaetales bacterium]|jgi:hypothetical protein|nr:NusG domain II-containing protein [Spirochaetales bacterium]